MTKPKILVTSAAGRTGAPAVMELLANGDPVRAFVRRRDERAEALELERGSAELCIGDMLDYRDVSMPLNNPDWRVSAERSELHLLEHTDAPQPVRAVV